MEVLNANFIGGTSMTVSVSTPSIFYNFLVSALNSVGTSIPSSNFSIIAASVPDPPTALTAITTSIT